MAVDTGLIYEFALGEGDQYAAALAAMLFGSSYVATAFQLHGFTPLGAALNLHGEDPEDRGRLGHGAVEVVVDHVERVDVSPDGADIRLRTEGLTNRADGNNVDLDKEYGELKRNALMFQAFSQLLASKMDTMRRAMQG